jgi:hypothetical protein
MQRGHIYSPPRNVLPRREAASHSLQRILTCMHWRRTKARAPRRKCAFGSDRIIFQSYAPEQSLFPDSRTRRAASCGNRTRCFAGSWRTSAANSTDHPLLPAVQRQSGCTSYVVSCRFPHCSRPSVVALANGFHIPSCHRAFLSPFPQVNAGP